MGSTRDRLKLPGNIVDPSQAILYAQKQDCKMSLAEFYANQTRVNAFLGEYCQALTMARKARGTFPYADYSLSFYEGLSSLAMARSATIFSRGKVIRLGRKAMKTMKRWSHNKSANFRDMLALL
jgi:hypothetical protein